MLAVKLATLVFVLIIIYYTYKHDQIKEGLTQMDTLRPKPKYLANTNTNTIVQNLKNLINSDSSATAIDNAYKKFSNFNKSDAVEIYNINKKLKSLRMSQQQWLNSRSNQTSHMNKVLSLMKDTPGTTCKNSFPDKQFSMNKPTNGNNWNYVPPKGVQIGSPWKYSPESMYKCGLGSFNVKQQMTTESGVPSTNMWGSVNSAWSLYK